MTDQVKDAEATAEKARRVVREMERAADDVARAVAAEVRKKHLDASGYAAANQRLADAEKALRQARDATPPHEWEGGCVFRVEPVHSKWGSRKLSDRRVDGIVETVRSGTEFPANTRWGRPKTGDVIVRLLKKDGTPGLKFEQLFSSNGICRWQLADAVGASS